MDDGFTGFRIGVAGLGLIGGSLAKAFKSTGLYVAGFDSAKSVVSAALKEGAVDAAGCEPSILFDCDIIFAALYPAGIVQFVKSNAPRFKTGSVVVDCCGIKNKVCAELYSAELGGNFTFIGGHPMAGTENSGYSASYAELFRGASFILTPKSSENSVIIEKLRDILLKAGFGRVVVTTPQHHDRMIAFTSQLPHVLACSYVMSPCCPQHDGFSAGSFRDISRVAHINPELWSQLFIENKDELCDEIDIMIKNMQAIRDAAASGDKHTLAALLQKARDIKDACACGGQDAGKI
jgi:prephenate dehydrogenase